MVLKKKIKKVHGCLAVLYHGFWYVDIPRTSSSSIRAELGSRFGVAHGKENVLDQEYATPQIFKDHIPARVMAGVFGDFIWNRIFTFTVVRNPWERLFSMYHYRKKIKNIPAEWDFRDYVFELDKAITSGNYQPFFRYHGFRYGLTDYILGKNDTILVDYIARFENRQHDLEIIGDRIKCEELGRIFAQKATPVSSSFRQHYDEEMERIVGKVYQKDIDLFGYSFRK